MRKSFLDYRKSFIMLLIAFILLGTYVVNVRQQVYAEPNAGAKALELFTEEERAWLLENPVIRVGPDPNYAPVEFFEEGVFKGLSIDYLSWISQTYGIQFNYVYYATWAEIMAALNSGEIMLQTGIIRTPERMKFLSFCDSYTDMPSVLMVRKDFNVVLTEDNLFDYRVGVIDDFALEEFIRNKYNPEHLYEQADVYASLSNLSTGVIDVMVLDLGQATYYVEKMGLTNLKISNDIPIDFKITLSFATQKDNEILAQIINKALDQMPVEVKRDYARKWLAIGSYTKIDYQLLMIVGGVLAVVMVLFIFVSVWLMTLRRKDLELARVNQALAGQIEALAAAQGQLVESEKINALSRLAIGIAHEINTPLGTGISMASFINTIAQEHQDQIPRISKPCSEFISQISECSEIGLGALQRAAKIIEDFKMVANFQQDQSEKYMDLSTEIVHIVNLLSSYDTMRIVPKLDIQPNLYALMSSNNLVQVLGVLMENSYMHGYQGEGGPVELSLKQVADEMVLIYKDFGRGIPQDVLPNIFEPFYSTKRGSDQLLGLGLYNAYNIVTQGLKGSISVTSEKDQGTVFQVRFPVR